jgi:hypothetical protein
MKLGKEVNRAISHLVTEIMIPMKLADDEHTRVGVNIERAMKKLAIALIEKMEKSTPSHPNSIPSSSQTSPALRSSSRRPLPPTGH